MKTFLFPVAALLAFPVMMQAEDVQKTDPASLATELRRMEDAPDAPLPDAWDIETPDGRYSISTEPLKHMDESDARTWMDQLARHLEGFPAAQTPADARPRLDRILARREFAGIGPPSAWELLKQRISAWLLNLLRRILGFVAQHPTSSTVLFWVVVAGTAGFLAWTLFRIWIRDEPIRPVSPPAGMAHTQTWREWVLAARRAAAKGDAREAIHCAYWAAILRLKETGDLALDASHTPREYLREVSAARREPLAALTSRLERFWYGRRAASAEDYRESLKVLEALGCQPD